MQRCDIILERNWWEAITMVDNRERDCFRRWMWFRVKPRLMRILKYAREDSFIQNISPIRTTHPKKRFDDWVKHISACSGLPAEFIPMFFESFSITRDEMWVIANHLQDDHNCDRFHYRVNYFPRDTFPGLDIHRLNQIKGNLYQVDMHGCRPAAIYIRLIILDSRYIDVKVIDYQARDDFKFHVGSYSYPVIPFDGTTFKKAIEEAIRIRNESAAQ